MDAMSEPRTMAVSGHETPNQSVPTVDGGLLSELLASASGGGQEATVAELIAPLDVDQLRGLVTELAAQIDQAGAAVPANGPAGVCDLAIAASAPIFGTTSEVVLSAQRSRPVSDARAVAMSAARASGISIPSIAEHFDKDHTSVIHAVRRTADRPRLTDAAARVADRIAIRFETERTKASTGPATPVWLAAGTTEPAGSIRAAVVAAAAEFGTTTETLVGPDRNRIASDGRAVAMRVARSHGHTLTAVAAHFEREHTTVLHAILRVQDTPPLARLAETIAAAGSPPDHGSNGGIADVVEANSQPTHTATIQPQGLPGSEQTRPALSVAR